MHINQLFPLRYNDNENVESDKKCNADAIKNTKEPVYAPSAVITSKYLMTNYIFNLSGYKLVLYSEG